MNNKGTIRLNTILRESRYNKDNNYTFSYRQRGVYNIKHFIVSRKGYTIYKTDKTFFKNIIR